MSATIASLQPGDRFKQGGIVFTIERIDLAADRCDLSGTYNRRACLAPSGKPRNFRWSLTYVAHLLDSGTAERNPAERCELCGEPDSGEMAEIVVRARSLIVHAEPCATGYAAQRGVPLASILA